MLRHSRLFRSTLLLFQLGLPSILALGLPSIVTAQIPQSGNGILFGPILYMGGSAATGTPPADLQSRIRLAWTAGIATYDNLGYNTLIGVEIFYSKRAYDIAKRTDPSYYADLRLEYIGLGPFMRYHWFLAGFNILYPMAAETNISNGDGNVQIAEYKFLDFAFEAKIGASFHLLGGSQGELRLTGFFTYPIARTFLGWDPKAAGSTLPVIEPINGRVLTLQAGISYIIGSNEDEQ